MNRPGQPYGKSPHGGNWGETPWDQAMQLPGSRQVGLAKKFLEHLGSWWRLEPHPEWVTVDLTESPFVRGRLDASDPYLMPYVAGTPDRRTSVIYLPVPRKVTVHDLRPEEDYRVEFFNPTNGQSTEIGWIRHRQDWVAPACPDESHDWVLCLSATQDVNSAWTK